MSALYVVNFQTAINEDWREPFSLTGADGATDLTGVSMAMDVKASSGAVVLSLSTANGRLVIEDALAGQFSVRVPVAVMATVAPGASKHDLVLTFAGGEVRRLWYGEITVLAGVTLPGAAP